MKKVRLLALAGLLVSLLTSANAVTYVENFSHNPSLDGWQVFGNTNLFYWNSTNQNLEVTWDSTQPNSYFYIPLATFVTKNDDFSFSFDLKLSEAHTNDSTGPLSLALGFLNSTNATDPGFEKGAGVSPNVAEFDYYPDGFFPPSYNSPATATPAFVDDTSGAFAPNDLSPYVVELPTNVLMHIAMTYTASNQTAFLAITTNGTPLAEFPGLVINTSGNGGFTDTSDFNVNMFSVSSFSEAGQFAPYVASIFARGTVGNLVVNVPPPAQNLSVFSTNGTWQVWFTDHLNWQYTLQRTTNFVSWQNVSASVGGNGTNLVLSDATAPMAAAFYRVSASRP